MIQYFSLGKFIWIEVVVGQKYQKVPRSIKLKSNEVVPKSTKEYSKVQKSSQQWPKVPKRTSNRSVVVG